MASNGCGGAAAAQTHNGAAAASRRRSAAAPVLMPPPTEPPPPLTGPAPPPPPAASAAATSSSSPAAAPAAAPSAPPHRPHRRYRTDDVADDGSTFADLLLPPPLVRALAAAGFARPSPVQRASIPLGLVGQDLIVQAKSGTGKTCAFAVVALRRVDAAVPLPQALIVAPTREVALQSCDVAQRIAAALPAPAPVAAAFVGGLPTADDQKRLRRTCHIAVGTPGRLCALAASGALPLARMRVFVLDEADALLRRAAAGSPRDDVLWLARQLPGGAGSGTGGGGNSTAAGSIESDSGHDKNAKATRFANGNGDSNGTPPPPPPPPPPPVRQAQPRAQVLAFSATFEPDLLADLEPLMDRPRRVLLCGDGVGLRGVRQFYALVDDGGGSGDEGGESSGEASGSGGDESCNGGGDGAADEAALQRVLARKCDALLRLLSGAASLRQAVVFCNRKPAAEWLARRLTAAGFPAAYVAADVAQAGRNAAMDAVRRFKVRAVVATDVLARGVDLERANLVALLDAPPDAATYVHRVGRTGRFGTRGVAVAFVTRAELAALRSYAAAAGCGVGALEPLPDPLPPSLYAFELEAGWERDAAARLAAAPVLPAPDSPPPVRRRRQQAEDQEEEGEGGEGDGSSSSSVESAGGHAAALEDEQQQQWQQWQQWQQQQQHQHQHGEWEAWAMQDAWRQWRAWQAYYAAAAAAGAAPGAAEDARGNGQDEEEAEARDGSSSGLDEDEGEEDEGEAEEDEEAGEDEEAEEDYLTGHAAALVARLVVTADAAPDGAAATAAVPSCSHGTHQHVGGDKPDASAAPPQLRVSGGGGGGGGRCWACAYAAWRRDYAAWQAQYEAWWRQSGGAPLAPPHGGALRHA